jgi:hypothetical protein
MGLDNKGRQNCVGIELRGNRKPLGIRNKGMVKGGLFGLEERFYLWCFLWLD